MPQSQTSSRGLGAVLVAQFLSALADNALLFAAIALLKSRSALAMLAGVNPLVAYGLVGAGAAAYSPAKYGILGELVTQDKLVKANGLLEGSTIAAILIGVVLGGYLADQGAHLAVGFTVVAYLLAALANLRIPALASASTGGLRSPAALRREFRHAVTALMKHPDGRFTLLGTSVFWGAGSTLRFLLIAWVPVALGLTSSSTAANLNGVVALGIAIGAAAAARFVSLGNVNRALPAGLALGVLILLLAPATNLYEATGLLVLIGICGGFYVVPLNALLQEKGHATVALAAVFGVVVLVAIGALAWSRMRGASPVRQAELSR